MSSNLPPGCNSADGGIDHALESAIEKLLDNITDAEMAEALIQFIPVIDNIRNNASAEGYAEGRLDALSPSDPPAGQKQAGNLLYLLKEDAKDFQAIGKEIDLIEPLMREAADELFKSADSLKESSTVGGEWDGSEQDAKDEYDRLMSLVSKINAAMSDRKEE